MELPNKQILIHPTYFPSIATFAVVLQKEVAWEAFDNFQKQTYRNRCYICTDQGRHMLNIPIKHVGVNEGRQLYRHVILDHSSRWQKLHWRTLETAYRTSPYFEFYEDDLKPLFENPFEGLLDFNLATIDSILSCLGIEKTFNRTSLYEIHPEAYVDARHLVDAKKSLPIRQEQYEQVFEERHGFIENLSVLDLLFNQGPNTVEYLLNQPLDYI